MDRLSSLSKGGFPSLLEVPIPALSFRQIRSLPYAPPDPLIGGLLRRAQIGVIAGNPGIGKTPLLAQLACCVLGGVPFLGRTTRPSPVMWLDSESDYFACKKMFERFEAPLNLPAGWDERFTFYAMGNPNDPNSRELEQLLTLIDEKRFDWIRDCVNTHQPHLVIIDTLFSLVGGAAKDEAHTRKWFERLRQITHLPCAPAIIVSTHMRKKDRTSPGPSFLDDPQEWLTQEILGSIVWSSAPNVRLGFDRLSDDGDDDSDRRVFAGFRRGRSVIPPVILEPQIAILDDRPIPICWQLVDQSTMAENVFTPTQKTRFEKIPLGTSHTWSDLESLTGCPKGSSLKRLIDTALGAGFLERRGARYRRKAGSPGGLEDTNDW